MADKAEQVAQLLAEKAREIVDKYAKAKRVQQLDYADFRDEFAALLRPHLEPAAAQHGDPRMFDAQGNVEMAGPRMEPAAPVSEEPCNHEQGRTITCRKGTKGCSIHIAANQQPQSSGMIEHDGSATGGNQPTRVTGSIPESSPSTSSSSPAPTSDQLGKHVWNTVGDKPWTCLKCFFYTANLRHIENGYCRHAWIKREWDVCARCGVVKNDRNIAKPCIGKVTIALRETPEVPAPSEGARGPLQAAIEICRKVKKEYDRHSADSGPWEIGFTYGAGVCAERIEAYAHSLSQSTAQNGFPVCQSCGKTVTTSWESHEEECQPNVEPPSVPSVEGLVRALEAAMPYIEFYAEREMNSPSNNSEAVRDTREMLTNCRKALASFEKQNSSEAKEK